MTTPTEVPFRALRRIGAFFAVDRDPLAGGTSAADLLTDPATVDAVVDRYAERLGTSRRDIAGSLFLQGWASRVVSIQLGCQALTGRSPDLDPANLSYRFPDVGPVELRIGNPHLTDPAADPTGLLDRHLGPLIVAVDERTGPGGRRLWGNVASAYAGALVMLGRQGFAGATALPEALVEYGDWTDGRFRRRTCCNLFRVEGYGLCGDCVIPRP